MEVRILIFDTEGKLQVSALADTPFKTPTRICQWKRIYGRVTVRIVVDLTLIKKEYKL